MKFSSQFRWFRQYELNEDFASICISYKKLKQPLSQCRKRDPSIPPPDIFVCQSSHRPVRALCTACDGGFWPILGKEVERVSKLFKDRAAFLLNKHGLSPLYKAAVKKRWWQMPWKKAPRPPQVETDAELAEQVRQLVDFAHVNALAVRKVCKKYDKVHRTGAGREYMQRVMRKEKGNSFLVDRALLHELEALHSSLNIQSPQDEKIAHELSKRCSSFARQGVLCAGGVVGEETLPGPYPLELNCALCLDVLFDPVGLKCGHVFCRSCACMAARVDPNKPKALENAQPIRRCPMCRQAAVFNDAIPLAEVGALVKQRFPKEWQERKDAESAIAAH
ncbi:E3 ubiquitin ligase [Klebsormidium nitens]|uniref:RING-type E3 ubiquitin transferase n=1 Tax=Klebsormidium nitens TaxID=105231 RepID=A0A0U9HK15_KLENI|nr:E3 ubiquitin ligase [Klebsormidium nitens]|eukprot:GAQ79428.1 E3 ubiquitin ligase [Klebsormidium nitens]